MKWFRHDADAMQDAKVERLLMRHGVTGYGVYFAIVELIAVKVSPTNLSFELEHDAELLEYKFRIESLQIQTIIDTCVELSLLEKTASGVITCFKLGERLDNTMSQNPQMKKIAAGMQQKEDSDENDMPTTEAKNPVCPVEKIIELYHLHCPTMTKVRIVSDKRKKLLQSRWRESPKHQTIEFWERFFSHVATSQFLIGNNDKQWSADFEWLINSSNFIKVVEGKYHGRS